MEKLFRYISPDLPRISTYSKTMYILEKQRTTASPGSTGKASTLSVHGEDTLMTEITTPSSTKGGTSLGVLLGIVLVIVFACIVGLALMLIPWQGW